MVVQTLHFVPLAHALLGDLLVCYSSSLVAHVTHTTNLFESPRRLWSRDLFDSLLWPRIFLSFLDNSFRYTFKITYLGTLGPFRYTWPTQAHLGPLKLTWAHFGMPWSTQVYLVLLRPPFRYGCTTCMTSMCLILFFYQFYSFTSSFFRKLHEN